MRVKCRIVQYGEWKIWSLRPWDYLNVNLLDISTKKTWPIWLNKFQNPEIWKRNWKLPRLANWPRPLHYKKKTHLIVEIKPTGPEFSSYKAFDGFQFPFIGSPPRFLVWKTSSPKNALLKLFNWLQRRPFLYRLPGWRNIITPCLVFFNFEICFLI